MQSYVTRFVSVPWVCKAKLHKVANNKCKREGDRKVVTSWTPLLAHSGSYGIHGSRSKGGRGSIKSKLPLSMFLDPVLELTAVFHRTDSISITAVEIFVTFCGWINGDK